MDIQRYIVNEDCNLKDALKKINDGYQGIVFVTDNDNRLVGTLTDGDVRRSILSGLDLEIVISKIMNRNYVFVNEGYSRKMIDNIFNIKKISQIPVLNENLEIIDLIFQDEYDGVVNNDTPVVIMAGGLGSRLAPLTNETPKPMLNVGDKPILETIVNHVRSLGFNNIIISINYKGEIIQNYFQDGSNFGVNITYVKEKKRLGTAGALKLAEKMLKRNFIVLNGDILTKIDLDSLLKYHEESDTDITIATKIEAYQIPYGVIEVDEERILKIDEKPEVKFLINGGIYCLNPRVLKYIPEDTYFDITKLIQTCIENNHKIASYPISEYWMDIGQMKDYIKANEEFNLLFNTKK